MKKRPTSERQAPRRVLVVTGTCGVGKSSVCREWAGRRKGAVIECDVIRTWIRNPSLRTANSYQQMLLAKHAAQLAQDYIDMGLDVAIDNVWIPPGLQYLLKRLRRKAVVRVFWLNCDPKENRRRDRRRGASDAMGGRVAELQAELDAMTWPEYVRKMDTTDQSVDEVIRRIEACFQQGDRPQAHAGPSARGRWPRTR